MPIDLNQIAPNATGKYSPNLHQWLAKHQKENLQVFRSDNSFFSHLYVGYIYDGDFIGMRMNEVLTKGRKAKFLCYGIMPQKKKWTPIPDFWEQYVGRGRCIFDLEHKWRFVGDENRYAQDGDTRVCQWCGAKMHFRRWTETVERTKWEVVD